MEKGYDTCTHYHNGYEDSSGSWLQTTCSGGDTSFTCVKPSRTDLDTFHKSYGFQLCSDLDEEQKYQVLELVHRYKAVFARDLSEVNECKGEPLQLTLHTDRKMFKRQFRLSEPDKIETVKQIHVMEDANIIERSTSNHSLHGSAELL